MKKISKLCICVATIIFLGRCTSKDKPIIEFKAFIHEKVAFTFNEKDIESIDWMNQSFKLKKSKLDSLRKNSLYNCMFSEYFILYHNNEILDTLNLLSITSSNVKRCFSKPYVCLLKNGVFSKEGWFVIVPFKSSKGEYHGNLFDSCLYSELKEEKLLNASNWSFCEEEYTISNSPNKLFFDDFNKKFKDEMVLSLSKDSLQVDIDDLYDYYLKRCIVYKHICN